MKKNGLTQRQRVEKRLKEQGEIGRNECLRVYITRLAAIMLDLKKDGWEFLTVERGGDYVYKLVSYPQNKVTTLQQ